MKASELYKDLIEQIDRIFPWFFVSIILFFSSFTGTFVGIMVYLEQVYHSIPILAIFLAIPLGASFLPIMLLTRINRNRYWLYDLIHPSLAQDLSVADLEVERHRVFEQTRRDVRRFPIFIFFSYMLFIVSFLYLIVFLRLPYGSW